jgi:hypothetical protein
MTYINMKNELGAKIEIQLQSGEKIILKKVCVGNRICIEILNGEISLGAIFAINIKDSDDLLLNIIILLKGIKDKQLAIFKIEAALNYLNPIEFLFILEASNGNLFNWNQINFLCHKYKFYIGLRYDSKGNCLSDDDLITIVFPNKKYSIGRFRKIESNSDNSNYEFDINAFSYNNL